MPGHSVSGGAHIRPIYALPPHIGGLVASVLVVYGGVWAGVNT